VDRVRVARVLATLVAFAIRWGGAGTVQVRATAEDKTVVIEIVVPGRRGARDLARLLTLAGRPGAGEHRGFSLGLSLARSIVELHGGTLGAVEAATGAAFAVRLPRPAS
jgi:K+-sensing histidine kinase KdpD